MKASRGEAVACTTEPGLGVKMILLRTATIRGMVRNIDEGCFRVNPLLKAYKQAFKKGFHSKQEQFSGLEMLLRKNPIH